MEEKNEMKAAILNDDELDKVAGGVTLDELQELPIGTRVRAVAGLMCGQCGTITEFQLDWGHPKYPKYYSWVHFDNGKETYLSVDEFEVI